MQHRSTLSDVLTAAVTDALAAELGEAGFSAVDQQAVKAQILTLRDKLSREGETFAALAERYSQCPTAMQGGVLGLVSRGLLFAPLEQALFVLPPGALSEPVATDLAWHLLLCEAVRPETPLAREEALPKVYQHPLHQRQKQQQRVWLRSLADA